MRFWGHIVPESKYFQLELSNHLMEESISRPCDLLEIPHGVGWKILGLVGVEFGTSKEDKCRKAGI